MQYVAKAWIRPVSGNPELTGQEKYREFDLEAGAYKAAYENARAICERTAAPCEEYCVQVQRNDGHEWSRSPWFHFNGQAWTSRNGGKRERRRQGT